MNNYIKKTSIDYNKNKPYSFKNLQRNKLK